MTARARSMGSSTEVSLSRSSNSARVERGAGASTSAEVGPISDTLNATSSLVSFGSAASSSMITIAAPAVSSSSMTARIDTVTRARSGSMATVSSTVRCGSTRPPLPTATTGVGPGSVTSSVKPARR
ncbi:MAG: hypothetical protein IPM79_20200 [Polyangiaceae bacterium]|nr:hypothetical protein [Polyangiaceae bacterium]